MSGLLQSLLLAAFTGWLGYAAAGRRWRQAERRSVYRDYLVAADEVLRLLRKFEEEWNAKPDALPALYGELMEKNLQLEKGTGSEPDIAVEGLDCGSEHTNER